MGDHYKLMRPNLPVEREFHQHRQLPELVDSEEERVAEADQQDQSGEPVQRCRGRNR